MAITKIDRTVLRTLEPAVLAKLNETLGADFGLHFDFKGGSYDREGAYAVLKLQIAVKSPDGVVVDKSRSDYANKAQLYDCDPKWLDKTFSTGGKTFKVVGLLTARRKNCVSILNTRTNEKRICSPAYVRMFIKGSSPDRIDRVTNHAEIQRRVDEMKRDNPEAYYADGEFQAAGMSEKQIYQHHYNLLLKGGLDKLFGSAPVIGDPDYKK